MNGKLDNQVLEFFGVCMVIIVIISILLNYVH